MKIATIGLLPSLVAGLATGIGAFPILFTSIYTEKIQKVLMGFGGGIMLATTIFSLLIPGIKVSLNLVNSKILAVSIVVLGTVLGWSFFWFIHAYLDREYSFKPEDKLSVYNWQQTWLFIIAIVLHNLPEGLIVGVGFSSDYVSNELALAIGIGLQNLPEGLIIALLLKSLNYSTRYALLGSFLTGLVEPIGCLVGAVVVGWSQGFLSWSMAFAAGTMLFVVCQEILPKIYSNVEGEGKLGAIFGFLVMIFLDAVFTESQYF